MKPNASMAQRQRDIFASNLRRCMASAKKEQIDIAKALGVTSSTVSDWVNAKKYPRVDKMQALADYLGVLLSDLREEIQKSPPSFPMMSFGKHLILTRLKRP